jgi:hypothetical protein
MLRDSTDVLPARTGLLKQIGTYEGKQRQLSSRRMRAIRISGKSKSASRRGAEHAKEGKKIEKTWA